MESIFVAIASLRLSLRLVSNDDDGKVRLKDIPLGALHSREH